MDSNLRQRYSPEDRKGDQIAINNGGPHLNLTEIYYNIGKPSDQARQDDKATYIASTFGPNSPSRNQTSMQLTQSQALSS